MRSILLAGLPARHVPTHAKPSRLPVAATTAGLTLSLMPAVLASTSSSASAAPTASATAAPSRVATWLPISQAAKPVGGKTTVQSILMTADGKRAIPGVRLGWQAFYASKWRTVGYGTTNAKGISRVAVPLPQGAYQVRSFIPTSRYYVGTISRAVQPAGTQTLGQRAVAVAKQHYGKAYRYGSAGPSTFDCSGFSSYVYRQLGKSLPRSSGQQAAALRRVAVSAKQVGDLIFTYTGGRVSHVGIYAGNNQMWAATKTGDIVRLQTIYSRTISVGRVG